MSANLLSLFLNKTCQLSSLITGDQEDQDDDHQDSSSSDGVDPVKIFDYKEQKVQFEWSILDYFVFLDDLNADVIIYFKNLVEVSMAHNPSLINLEFKFRSTDTVARMCERDDIALLDAFFASHSLKNFNDGINNETNYLENENILRYVDDSAFFLDINYCQCFETAISNQNEKIAIHLILMLK